MSISHYRKIVNIMREYEEKSDIIVKPDTYNIIHLQLITDVSYKAFSKLIDVGVYECRGINGERYFYFIYKVKEETTISKELISFMKKFMKLDMDPYEDLNVKIVNLPNKQIVFFYLALKSFEYTKSTFICDKITLRDSQTLTMKELLSIYPKWDKKTDEEKYGRLTALKSDGKRHTRFCPLETHKLNEWLNFLFE